MYRVISEDSTKTNEVVKVISYVKNYKKLESALKFAKNKNEQISSQVFCRFYSVLDQDGYTVKS